jgi:hypothetical protein
VSLLAIERESLKNRKQFAAEMEMEKATRKTFSS